VADAPPLVSVRTYVSSASSLGSVTSNARSAELEEADAAADRREAAAAAQRHAAREEEQHMVAEKEATAERRREQRAAAAREEDRQWETELRRAAAARAACATDLRTAAARAAEAARCIRVVAIQQDQEAAKLHPRPRPQQRTPRVVKTRDEIDRKQSKICIIISYHIFLLGNDTETIRSKTILITKN
jgi:hypothetical protein